MKNTDTRVDRRRFFVTAGSTASADSGFPHVCAVPECAICRWVWDWKWRESFRVQRYPYSARGGESISDIQAKLLDSRKENTENRATRTSTQMLNRA